LKNPNGFIAFCISENNFEKTNGAPDSGKTRYYRKFGFKLSIFVSLNYFLLLDIIKAFILQFQQCPNNKYEKGQFESITK